MVNHCAQFNLTVIPSQCDAACPKVSSNGGWCKTNNNGGPPNRAACCIELWAQIFQEAPTPGTTQQLELGPTEGCGFPWTLEKLQECHALSSATFLDRLGPRGSRTTRKCTGPRSTSRTKPSARPRRSATARTSTPSTVNGTSARRAPARTTRSFVASEVLAQRFAFQTP